MIHTWYIVYGRSKKSDVAEKRNTLSVSESAPHIKFMLNHYILPNQQRTVKAKRSHMPLEKTTAEQTKRKCPLRKYWPEQKNTSRSKKEKRTTRPTIAKKGG